MRPIPDCTLAALWVLVGLQSKQRTSKCDLVAEPSAHCCCGAAAVSVVPAQEVRACLGGCMILHDGWLVAFCPANSALVTPAPMPHNIRSPGAVKQGDPPVPHV